LGVYLDIIILKLKFSGGLQKNIKCSIITVL